MKWRELLGKLRKLDKEKLDTEVIVCVSNEFYTVNEDLMLCVESDVVPSGSVVLLVDYD